MRVFLNLCAGLDRLGIGYHVNDYHCQEIRANSYVSLASPAYSTKWPGKIHLIRAAVYSHPLDDLQLFERLPVQKVLVPGRG